MGSIMVLGGTGMLGHKMFQVLKQAFPNTFCTIRGSVKDEPCRRIGLFQSGNVIEGVDALDLTAMGALLRSHRPQMIVNCVGMIKQHTEAELHVASTIMLNSVLPHKLAEVCSAWGGRLIHISTDCVFSGRCGGHIEDDQPDAADLYGRTKFLGEVNLPNALTLRTSFVGREVAHFRSLLEWFLAQQHETVRGFTRAVYSGVTTNHLARVVVDLIRSQPTLSGLYQVTGETISKYNLLRVLGEAYELDIEILPDDSICCNRSMSGQKFQEATGYKPPSWLELADELAHDPTPYDRWRQPG